MRLESAADHISLVTRNRTTTSSTLKTTDAVYGLYMSIIVTFKRKTLWEMCFSTFLAKRSVRKLIPLSCLYGKLEATISG